MAEKIRFNDMRDRTIGELFDEMCVKHAQKGGIEDIGYLFRMRNPLNNEIMNLKLVLKREE